MQFFAPVRRVVERGRANRRRRLIRPESCTTLRA
jgi:hypothetical protein